MDHYSALLDCIDRCMKCAPAQPTPFAFDGEGARHYGLLWPQGLWLCEDAQQLALYRRVLDWENACADAQRAHPRTTSALEAFSQNAGLSLLDDCPVLTDGVLLQIVSRRELDREERARIAPLARRLRCTLTNRWPSICRCRPYRMHSAPDPDDLRLMHEGLQAAQRILSAPRRPDSLPVLDAQGGVRWEPLPPLAVPQFPRHTLRNELLRERLKRLPVRSGAWEVTVQALFNPSQAPDGGAPVYHLMLIVVDEESDAVLQMSVSTLPGADGAPELAEAFFEEAVQSGWLPEQLHCANPRTEALLSETLRALPVAVDQRASLPQLLAAYCSLLTGEQT